MAKKRIFNAYAIAAMVGIAIMAFVGLCGADVLIDIVTSRDFFIFSEVVFMMLIVGFLMYAFILLIERFSRNYIG